MACVHLVRETKFAECYGVIVAMTKAYGYKTISKDVSRTRTDDA